MEEIDLKELLSYFRSKILWIILVIILVIVVGNVYTILTRVPMYQSNTTIVLVSENQNETYNSNELQMNKNLVSTYSEIIKSRKVLKQVKENLGLKTSVNNLSKNINVSAVTDTELIRITVSDSKASRATEVANEIAKVFSDEIQTIYKLNNVSIVDVAVDAAKPFNVNYIKDNIIYIAIGIVLASGLIFIKFYFDTTIKTSEEIENKLGLTVMGIVPKVEKE